jgi:magnesium transporter
LAATLIESVQFVNAAPVTVTYYVFTTVTIITSAILFQGFKDTPIGIAMAIMGFLQICAGIILLQLPKLAEDVSYTAIFKGN